MNRTLEDVHDEVARILVDQPGGVPSAVDVDGVTAEILRTHGIVDIDANDDWFRDLVARHDSTQQQT